MFPFDPKVLSNSFFISSELWVTLLLYLLIWFSLYKTKKTPLKNRMKISALSALFLALASQSFAEHSHDEWGWGLLDVTLPKPLSDHSASRAPSNGLIYLAGGCGKLFLLFHPFFEVSIHKKSLFHLSTTVFPSLDIKISSFHLHRRCRRKCFLRDRWWQWWFLFMRIDFGWILFLRSGRSCLCDVGEPSPSSVPSF